MTLHWPVENYNNWVCFEYFYISVANVCEILLFLSSAAALEEVEQFEQIEESLQVLQFLRDTRGFLKQVCSEKQKRNLKKFTLFFVIDDARGERQRRRFSSVRHCH